jgi:hypothetical protein
VNSLNQILFYTVAQPGALLFVSVKRLKINYMDLELTLNGS